MTSEFQLETINTQIRTTEDEPGWGFYKAEVQIGQTRQALKVPAIPWRSNQIYQNYQEYVREREAGGDFFCLYRYGERGLVFVKIFHGLAVIDRAVAGDDFYDRFGVESVQLYEGRAFGSRRIQIEGFILKTNTPFRVGVSLVRNR